MPELPITKLVTVNIVRDDIGFVEQNIETPLILTDEDSGWGVGELVRTYSSSAELLEDFSSGSETYLMGEKIFSQTPRIREIKVGAEGTRTAQVQTLVLDADLVASNTLAVSVNGTVVSTVFATDHVTTMGAMATALAATAAIGTAVVGGAGNRTITMTAAKPGVPFTLSSASVTGGASQAAVVLAETTANVGPAEFIADIDEYDSDWYVLLWNEKDEDLVEQAAQYIETVRKTFYTTTNDADAYDAVDTDDIGYRLNAAEYDRTVVFYHPTATDHLDAAAAGEYLTYRPGQQILANRGLNGVTPATNLTSSRVNALEGKEYNYYATVRGQNIILNGRTAKGSFYDVVRDIDYITGEIEDAIFRLQINNSKKLPYTQAGIQSVADAISETLQRMQAEEVVSRDPLPREYAARDDSRPFRVDVPSINDVDVNDRANRILRDITFVFRLTNAIQTIIVNGTVTV